MGLWLAAVLLASSTCVFADAPDAGIAVIVAQGLVPPKLSREELALIFKQKRRFWEDGTRIQPVNLPASHSLRQAFSQLVMGEAPEELDDYWREMYFHGVLPPFVLASDEAVIRFVAGTPGAIGYVSNCVVDHRVRVILRLDAVTNCGH